MNIWNEIQDLEVSKAKLSESQDRILDIFDKNNTEHTRLLKQTVELQREYEALYNKYKELAKEY